MKTALGVLLIVGGILTLIFGICGTALSEVQGPFIAACVLGAGAIVGAIFIFRRAK